MRPLRVVIADLGPGDEEQPVGALARGLRDTGLEVIFVGVMPSTAAVAEVVLQEDADAAGIAAGTDGAELSSLLTELDRRGLDEVVAFVSSIGDVRPEAVTHAQTPRSALFAADRPIADIAGWLTEAFTARASTPV